MYAARKRRRPVQRGVKQASAEATKSNPSKRHRDRLNSELDRLASLLPFSEEVTSSLDKLSILRLSVSYLRTKNFFSVALKTQPANGLTLHSGPHDDSKTTGLVDGSIPEGELLLQALNGFVLVVTAEGSVFFCSHTIQDYLGFHQTDVMNQSVFELIHTEDQPEFRSNLHWALNPPNGTDPTRQTPTDGEQVDASSPATLDPRHLPPENSSFLERSFVCRFRCLLDNSSGFLALNVQGRLKFLHGQNQNQADGAGGTSPPPRLALFAIATPLQPPAILEIRTRNMIFRTKHKLDFTPMACDAKGKIVLGYTEAELRVRGSGYQFIHAADMLYCAENHVRMIKTGESGLTVFRLLTKENRWKWVQANARLVYKNGKPDYIIATQRPLVEEEGGEHLRKRSMHLPFTFATGEALLYHSSYPMHGFPDSTPGKAKGGKAKKGRADKSSRDDIDPNSLLGALMSQDKSVYVCQPATDHKASFHGSLFGGQQGESAGTGGDGWSPVANATMTGRGSEAPFSYDPLLATLDSLSLDGDEPCSNSELFTALENLGLNAEDLELLLLDERMMKVELDPNHVPTLTDLLTNNEILSYIQDSLEIGGEVDEPGNGGSDSDLSALPPAPASTQRIPHQPLATPIPYPAPHPTSSAPRQGKQPPIVQLSQEMQQHISTSQMASTQSWTHSEDHIPPLSESGPLDASTLTGLHSSPWGTTMENTAPAHPRPNHLQTAANVSEAHREMNPPCVLQEDALLQHLQTHFPPRQSASGEDLNGDHTRLQWADYRDRLQLTTDGPFPQNGHDSLLHAARVSHADYNMADAPSTNTVIENSMIIPDVCHFQEAGSVSQPFKVPTQRHRQQEQMLQPTQHLPSCSPQCPAQSSSLDLEQLLALPSLDAYGMFNTTDANHSKMENGCIVSTTNAAYLRSCLMPNGNAVVTTDNPISCTDTLSTLQDPQKTGFYL